MTIYIASLRLAERLCQDQVSLELYRSDGPATFHTSDAPAQELLHKANEKKEFLAFLGVLPLTPQYFMKIVKDHSSRGGIIFHPADRSMVAWLNGEFVRESRGADVDATSRDALLRV